MPIEIIRKILEERAIEKAEEVKRNAEMAEEIRLKALEANRIAKERSLFIEKQTEKILNESTVLAGLVQINKELLENGRIVAHQNGVELVWNETNLGRYDHEYFYINIHINPDDESVVINGENRYEFNKNQWKDKTAIDTALAKAFLNPDKHKYTPEKDLGGDIGGGR